ncbi:hypothetical protein TNCV_1266361 [Trichonephila clavipes]|nr:hypothetical protein TNCV_1266361 [Trichonephila clavipes]
MGSQATFSLEKIAITVAIGRTMRQTREWQNECKDLERCDEVEETCTYVNFPLFPESLQEVPATAYLGTWIGHGGYFTWPLRSPDLKPLYFLFCCHLKSLAYEKLANFTEWIVVASADNASTPDLFERSRQSFVRQSQLFYDLQGATSNNSCDNHL